MARAVWRWFADGIKGRSEQHAGTRGGACHREVAGKRLFQAPGCRIDTRSAPRARRHLSDNNSAYWEAGFAEEMATPAIYMCEDRVFERNGTHFDTNHLTTVVWSYDRPDEFVAELIETIKNTSD